MDNATHTLAALLLAELALAARSRDATPVPKALRPAALVVSAIANNFPDLDFLYAGLTGEKLGYLLHHRGHTHTLAAALPQAVASLALVAPFVGRARTAFQRVDWGVLFSLALLGPVVHIAMDFSNNYGVHPFWPLSNRWHYGDFVFIVEPLLFAAIVPTLFWSARTWWGRAPLALLLLVVLALTFFTGLVPLSMAIITAALVVLLFFALRRAQATTRAVVGLAAAVCVVSTFFIASRVAERRLRAMAGKTFPTATTHDVIVTPLPASPLCFDFILVQTQGKRYVLRPGVLALGPALPRLCGRGLRGERTAKLEPEAAVAGVDIEFAGRFEAPLVALGELARHCQAHALLRFARAPFYTRDDHDKSQILGDARYDREPGLGFAEVRIASAPSSCPRFVPPWVPPRQELWE